MNSIDPKVYTADYYRSSNYADYLERSDRYKKTAYELTSLLRLLGLVDKDSLIVDFGCAIGFLIEGFKDAGFVNVRGVEISEWARIEALKRGHSVFPDMASIQGKPELLIAMDVFEHMTDLEVGTVLRTAKARGLLVRIPSSTDGGKTFHLDVSKADPTHINCKTKDQWIEFFKGIGYQTFLKLNLYTVYDTPGVTCLLIL